MRGIFIFADSETALLPLLSADSESENVLSLLLESFRLIKRAMWGILGPLGLRGFLQIKWNFYLAV